MKRKDVFVSTIKGLITGIVSWVNGISVATMLLSVSSYNDFLNGLSNINIKKKDNKLLWYVTIPIIIGICLGLLAGFHLVIFFWNKYQLQTIILFVGLFIGGIRIVYNKQKLSLNKKSIFIPVSILIVSILLIFYMNNINITIKNSILSTAILGIITGISFLIPGASASAKHINNGYNELLNAIKHINSVNNCVLIIIFVIVCLLVLILLSKIIKRLIDKNKNNSYLALCTLMIVNIILLIIQIKPFSITFINIFTSILAFLWGFIFAKNVERE